mmetsp:Transcript_4076/g.5445  ORF Transcript_4076/g.5445 Transcript_4076/m.5445 type:complete len:226 (+) Transcript_4076:189-866(+)
MIDVNHIARLLLSYEGHSTARLDALLMINNNGRQYVFCMLYGRSVRTHCASLPYQTQNEESRLQNFRDWKGAALHCDLATPAIASVVTLTMIAIIIIIIIPLDVDIEVLGLLLHLREAGHLLEVRRLVQRVQHEVPALLLIPLDHDVRARSALVVGVPGDTEQAELPERAADLMRHGPQLPLALAAAALHRHVVQQGDGHLRRKRAGDGGQAWARHRALLVERSV